METDEGEEGYGKLVAENGREFVIKPGSTMDIDIGREKRPNDLNYFNLSD